ALLMEQSVMALNWMQQSGEYRALAYQAFNAAQLAFDSAITTDNKKKAVIVDLDETMIDNSAEGATRVITKKGYSKESWATWCSEERAKAIPGALDFANYVTAQGGKIFYVSNRNKSEHQHTVNNLQKLGFPNVDETSVFLKDKESQKTSRFEEAEKQGYAVVLFIGDNLDDFDFTGETYHQLNDERRAVVDKNKTEFGIKYILLPNPIYGNWEGGLGKDYFKSSPKEKVKIRRDNLIKD
ncbi:MAG: 5'-nucleotidase, lipoprotein e(P4) family, partial [Treponema sp.]